MAAQTQGGLLALMKASGWVQQEKPPIRGNGRDWFMLSIYIGCTDEGGPLTAILGPEKIAFSTRFGRRSHVTISAEVAGVDEELLDEVEVFYAGIAT